MEMLPGATFLPWEGDTVGDPEIRRLAHGSLGPKERMVPSRQVRALAGSHPGPYDEFFDALELCKSSAGMTTSEMNPSA